jgi:hypothetical protein
MSATNTRDEQPAKTETVYKVTVTKIVRNFPFRNRDYKEIGTKENERTHEVEEDYGYVYFDDTKNVNTDIYEQEIEKIDLPEVIKAVNGMDK